MQSTRRAEQDDPASQLTIPLYSPKRTRRSDPITARMQRGPSEGARCASKRAQLLALPFPLMASCPPWSQAWRIFSNTSLRALFSLTSEGIYCAVSETDRVRLSDQSQGYLWNDVLERPRRRTRLPRISKRSGKRKGWQRNVFRPSGKEASSRKKPVPPKPAAPPKTLLLLQQPVLLPHTSPPNRYLNRRLPLPGF